MSYTAEPRQPKSPAERGKGKGEGVASSRESPVALASSSAPIDLAIVTTYATAPVTAVSELWVGGSGDYDDVMEGNRGGGSVQAVPGAGLERGKGGGGSGTVRLAVAGRSGSSRMSVWDITEARQILEVTRLFGEPDEV